MAVEWWGKRLPESVSSLLIRRFNSHGNRNNSEILFCTFVEQSQDGARDICEEVVGQEGIVRKGGGVSVRKSPEQLAWSPVRVKLP